MIPQTILIASRPFGGPLGPERVAEAIAQGLSRGGRSSVDLCPLSWDGRRREQLLAELDELGFDERMRASRAVILAEPELREPTLRTTAAFELATRARQGGVPCYAVTAHNALEPFDARILDLQVVLEAADPAALRTAGRRLGGHV